MKIVEGEDIEVIEVDRNSFGIWLFLREAFLDYSAEVHFFFFNDLFYLLIDDSSCELEILDELIYIFEMLSGGIDFYEWDGDA